jgi:hypothetical protein
MRVPSSRLYLAKEAHRQKAGCMAGSLTASVGSAGDLSTVCRACEFTMKPDIAGYELTGRLQASRMRLVGGGAVKNGGWADINRPVAAHPGLRSLLLSHLLPVTPSLPTSLLPPGCLPPRSFPLSSSIHGQASSISSFCYPSLD